MKKRYKILTDPNILFQKGDVYKWKHEDDIELNWKTINSDRWIVRTLLDVTGTKESFKAIIWRREIKRKNIG